MEIKATIKIFDGYLIRFSHNSSETNTVMTCAVYLPFKAYLSRDDNTAEKVPIVYYLSGLTCTDENVCQKSGVFKILANLQVRVTLSLLIALICFVMHRSLLLLQILPPEARIS